MGDNATTIYTIYNFITINNLHTIHNLNLHIENYNLLHIGTMESLEFLDQICNKNRSAKAENEKSWRLVLKNEWMPTWCQIIVKWHQLEKPLPKQVILPSQIALEK